MKSDVYSFGVMLLELMSGKRSLEEDRGGMEEALVDWAIPFLEDQRKVVRIMDTRLEGQYVKKAAQTLASVAQQCLHADPKIRPSMAEVLAAIEDLQVLRNAPRSSKGTPNHYLQRYHP